MEKQLRSWTPREPSERVKGALFGSATELEPRGARCVQDGSAAMESTGWNWLAPAMAVFLLGLFVYSNQAGLLHQFHPDPSPSLLATAALSQPEFSTYYASLRHSDNNALRNTFEWTNGNRSLSTAAPMAQTNRVMQ